jgi:hypothetical protein
MCPHASARLPACAACCGLATSARLRNPLTPALPRTEAGVCVSASERVLVVPSERPTRLTHRKRPLPREAAARRSIGLIRADRSVAWKAGAVTGSSLGARSAHADVRRLIDRVFAEGRKRNSVSQLLDLAIVAHCVDVDPQKIPDSSRDPEGGRFRTGRDHDRKPRVGVADFLDRHSPQQLAV